MPDTPGLDEIVDDTLETIDEIKDELELQLKLKLIDDPADAAELARVLGEIGQILIKIAQLAESKRFKQ
jgi:hypothetical protein